MRKSVAFGLLLMMACLVSLTASFAPAADYTKVGVRVGDTADYNAGIGSTTAKTRMHVAQIVGTNVTLTFNTLNPDGSETVGYNIAGDIAAGSSGIYVFLIVPNLNQGDPIFSGAPEGFAIDHQTTMAVAGANRVVNHYGYSLGTSLSIDVYWDKATGLAVKIDETFSGNHLTFQMISTTAFAGISVDPVTLVIVGVGVVAVVVVIAVVAAVMHRRKAVVSAGS